MHPTGNPPAKPSADERCRSCGNPLAVRLTAAGTARVRSCVDARCPLHGIPKIQQARHSITFDASGNAVDAG